MSHKIGLISDVHATLDPLREALTLLREAGAATILCAGDIAGYGVELEQTLALLNDSGCRVVFGNHDLWWLERHASDPAGPAAQYLHSLPREIVLEAAGKRVYMIHASPPASLMDGIVLLDEQGDLIAVQRQRWARILQDLPFDVLVVGHTHQVFAESLGGVLVVNPGSTLFNHTCALLSLPELKVEFLALGGREPLLAWNWGMMCGGEQS